jgi:hypothetical protein
MNFPGISATFHTGSQISVGIYLSTNWPNFNERNEIKEMVRKDAGYFDVNHQTGEGESCLTNSKITTVGCM